MTQVTLTATEGALKNHEFVFAEPGQVLIGRSHDCSLRLDDLTVSRRHCLVEVGDEAAWVRDLHSLNGTLVNGEALRAPRLTGAKAAPWQDGLRRLRDGDDLSVGTSVFRVRVRATAVPEGEKPDGAASLEPEPELYAMSA